MQSALRVWTSEGDGKREGERERAQAAGEQSATLLSLLPTLHVLDAISRSFLPCASVPTRGSRLAVSAIETRPFQSGIRRRTNFRDLKRVKINS